MSVHCCTCPRTVERIPKTKRSLKPGIVTIFEKRPRFRPEPRFRSEPQIRLDEMAWLQFLVVGCSSQNAVLRWPGCRNLLHCAALPNLYAITQGRSPGVKGAATGSDGGGGQSSFRGMGRRQTHSWKLWKLGDRTSSNSAEQTPFQTGFFVTNCVRGVDTGL